MRSRAVWAARRGALEAVCIHSLASPDDDVVFVELAGSHLDGSAPLRRHKRALKKAHIRPLRFYDLGHTLGTTMIRRASIVQVKACTRHADVATATKYLHDAPRHEHAELVDEALACVRTIRRGGR